MYMYVCMCVYLCIYIYIYIYIYVFIQESDECSTYFFLHAHKRILYILHMLICRSNFEHLIFRQNIVNPQMSSDFLR